MLGGYIVKKGREESRRWSEKFNWCNNIHGNAKKKGGNGTGLTRDQGGGKHGESNKRELSGRRRSPTKNEGTADLGYIGDSRAQKQERKE